MSQLQRADNSFIELNVYDQTVIVLKIILTVTHLNLNAFQLV